ncbi:MAG: deoxyribose-phosphate aldolase [Dethiobacteria bacterium]
MDPTLKLEHYIESTLLRADAQKQDIENLCSAAVRYNFCGVCVNPYYIPLASLLLRGSSVKLVTVIGFPLGSNDGYIKALEAEWALKNGAEEIDMVLNIGALKNRDIHVLLKEIKDIVGLGVTVKVIIEIGYLTPEDLKTACHCAVEGGARFIKTSTGFGPRGVTLKDISSLRAILPQDMGIKASGGIKTAAFARDLINAGANRIGSSAAEEIILE